MPLTHRSRTGSFRKLLIGLLIVATAAIGLGTVLFTSVTYAAPTIVLSPYNLSQASPEACNSAHLEDMQVSHCIVGAAIVNERPTFCNAHPDPEQCYYMYAERFADPSWCATDDCVRNAQDKIALTTQDPDACVSSRCNDVLYAIHGIGACRSGSCERAMNQSCVIGTGPSTDRCLLLRTVAESSLAPCSLAPTEQQHIQCANTYAQITEQPRLCRGTNAQQLTCQEVILRPSLLMTIMYGESTAESTLYRALR